MISFNDILSMSKCNDKKRELLVEALREKENNIKELSALVNEKEEVVEEAIDILRDKISKVSKEYGMSFNEVMNKIVKNC